MVKSVERNRGDLTYNGHLIHLRSEMVNLTDMWRASGSPPFKDPSKWIRLDVTKELIEVLAFNVRRAHIMKATRGKGGSTWAIANLAVSYAKYLSPKFHAWANQAIVERIQEDSDPELGLTRSRDRAVEYWRKRGKSDRWIHRRLEGISARHRFTDTLQDHGINEGKEYAICTNAIYKPVLGGTAKEVKLDMDLPANANLRDHLEATELAAVSLSESLAEEAIANHGLDGLRQCERACEWSGDAVSNALTDARNNQPFVSN